MNEQDRESVLFYVVGTILISILLLFVFIVAANAEDVDLSIISKIESSNNPLAYNKGSGALGLYQITPVCYQDYLKFHVKQYNFKEDVLLKGKEIANWYLNKRIPQLLKHYKIKDTIEMRLIAYNWGIGNLVKYSKNQVRMPKETADYIKKYKKERG